MPIRLQAMGGKKGCPQTAARCSYPLAGSRFGGRERLNPPRKGLSNAPLARWLLLAMFSQVCVCRTLA